MKAKVSPTTGQPIVPGMPCILLSEVLRRDALSQSRSPHATATTATSTGVGAPKMVSAIGLMGYLFTDLLHTSSPSPFLFLYILVSCPLVSRRRYAREGAIWCHARGLLELHCNLLSFSLCLICSVCFSLPKTCHYFLRLQKFVVTASLKQVFVDL